MSVFVLYKENVMPPKAKAVGYPFLTEAHPTWMDDRLPPKSNQPQGQHSNLHVVSSSARQQAEQTQQ